MAAPVERLVFHVGDIKSATTSVQVVLAVQRDPVSLWGGHLLSPVRGLNHN